MLSSAIATVIPLPEDDSYVRTFGGLRKFMVIGTLRIPRVLNILMIITVRHSRMYMIPFAITYEPRWVREVLLITIPRCI